MKEGKQNTSGPILASWPLRATRAKLWLLPGTFNLN